MKLSLQSQIRFMRRFRGVKPGFADNLAVGHYLRAPFSLVRADTEKTNFVGFGGLAHVLKIAEPRHLAQVAKTVVALIAVYVVNVLRWPFPRHIRPRKTMRELLAVMNGYGPVSGRLRRPGLFTNKIGAAFMRAPRKNACVSVVVQRRSQMLDCAWRIKCHDNLSTIGGLK